MRFPLLKSEIVRFAEKSPNTLERRIQSASRPFQLASARGLREIRVHGTAHRSP